MINLTDRVRKASSAHHVSERKLDGHQVLLGYKVWNLFSPLRNNVSRNQVFHY